MNSINDLDEESDEEWRKEIYVEVEDRNMYMTYMQRSLIISVYIAILGIILPESLSSL